MKTFIIMIILMLQTNVLPQNNFKEMDKLLNDAYKMDIFSGVVLIADKENVQYLKAFGNSDYDTQSPNVTDTKFNIGSIGKLFTQILITQLIQEGRLKQSDNLEKVYPIYKNENDKKITVKLLLTFSAGLGDYFRIDEFNQNPEKYIKIADLISAISKEPLLYEPGSSNEYSNSSYVVLGGIIEKITGKSYLEN
ncbi:MAG: serine hydrolase domain-containing protein, partial [Ignavibacteriota bacterium]